MTKHTSTIDQHRRAIGQHENKQHKPRKPKPRIKLDSSLKLPISPDFSLKPSINPGLNSQQAAPKKAAGNLTAQQKRARAKQKAAHARAEQKAHVNILPSAALTVLVMLTLFPQPVEARKESKQKSVTGNDGIPHVSLAALEEEGKVQNVFFPDDLVEGYRYKTSGVGFDSTAHLLALLKAETTQHYSHAKGNVNSQPIVTVAMRRVDLKQTEDCLTNTGLNATCATTGLVSLPGHVLGENSASAATNGKKTVFNIGPLIPDDNICLDTTEPMYPYGANPSRGAVIYNEAVVLPNQALYSTSPRDYYAPWHTLKTGIELVDAEHVNLLGEDDATLLVKGVVVKQENGVVASTLYVNQYDSVIANTYIDVDPLCVVTNAGEIIQSKLSVVVGEDGQVKRRDLILAHLPTPDSSDAKVIIISDIDHRQGQNIDLNTDPIEQNIQVLSGFNWGDAKTRGVNLIDVVSQEIEALDPQSDGLDDSSTDMNDTDSTGLGAIRQQNLLLISSSGKDNTGSYSRPRAFIIDIETNTRIGIQDRSDVTDSSDLGHTVIAFGELNQRYPDGKEFYSNYPVITRPSTGELFVLSPQTIAILMTAHRGETVLDDVGQLSELIIDDPELLCPEFAKKLFVNEETAQLGMECGHTENSTTMAVLHFQKAADSATKRPLKQQDSTVVRASKTNTERDQSAAEDSNVLPVVNCGSFWSKENVGVIAAVSAATIITMGAIGAYASCGFFRENKRPEDRENINVQHPHEGMPLMVH